MQEKLGVITNAITDCKIQDSYLCCLKSISKSGFK